METTIISDTQASYDPLTSDNCGQCLHCQSKIVQEQKFCCFGCETAYHICTQTFEVNKENIFFPFVQKDDDNLLHLTLHIKGVHCASCIQLIEKTLLQEDYVVTARVNMSTQRIYIAWYGNEKQADCLAYLVEKLGYKLSVTNQENAVTETEIYEKSLLYSLAVSGFGMGNLMLLSVALWSSDAINMTEATRDLLHWLSAMIALPVVIYAGKPFFNSAWTVLKNGHTNMDVPISIGVILACIMSLFETFNHGEHIYFDSAVMLIFFLLIGRYFDVKARGKARKTAEYLLSKLQGTATIIEQDGIRLIPIQDLTENMIVRVTAGSNIPADGHIISGETEIDTSLITGETIPVFATQGTKVFTGTVNLLNAIDICVEKKNEYSLLSQIVKLMEQAEQGQAHYVRLADKIAKLYTPVVHLLGLLAFVFWFGFMGLAWQKSLMIATTVLIITCPCALALAVPVVQILATGQLMKQGILLKSGDALERLQKITTVIFDKTGTLTFGKPTLIHQSMIDPLLLQYTASLACHSKHPLSQAIIKAFTGNMLPALEVKEFAGKGLQGIIDNKIIKIGNRHWCNVPDEETNNIDTKLELWINIDNQNKYCFEFVDTLRDDAKYVIETLRDNGLNVILLSGDRKQVVQNTAQELGIKIFEAAYSPTDKAHYIQNLKNSGHNILMVGDGLNDAPSLASSHISMSPATALDIVQNTADIVFQGNKLYPIITSYKIATKTHKLVKENFALALLYNIFAIPLAVMGYVTPLIAALAMSSSSLIVIANSFRLLKKEQ